MKLVNELNISLLQVDLFWEDKKANINKFNRLFDQIDKSSDLIILPEMFTTGFSMNAKKLAEKINGQTQQWLVEKAGELDSMIIGSVIIEEKTNFFNRLLAVYPDGNCLYYDKRHLFSIEGESDLYTAGNKHLVLNYLGWRISPFICYDLRFPVWSRNRGDYDIYLNVANWPGIRREIWISLLKARAIENQSYAIGVNRIGKDFNGTLHTGDSMIIDPKGKIISQAQQNKEEIISTKISLSELKNFRKKFPAYLDADDFNLVTGD